MRDYTGKNNPFYGKKHTKETIEKIRQSAKNRIGYWEGKKLSLDHKCNISKNHVSMKGSKNPMYGIRRLGKDSPNWKGGISKIKYPRLYLNIRKEILKRDNYTCQNCGLQEYEHKQIFKKGLEIHHIDYNKKNNGVFNLITLCRTCNGKANSNRQRNRIYFLEKVCNCIIDLTIESEIDHGELIRYKLSCN